MKAKIPWALVLLRLALGPAMLLAGWLGAPGWLLVTMLAAGFLSDIFDGILARRWNVVTIRLRVWDSNVDTAFYLCAVAAGLLRHGAALRPWIFPLAVLAAAFAAVNLVVWARFRCQPAFHLWSGKAWGITVFGATVALLLGRGLAFWIPATVLLGLINAADNIATALILPRPASDLRSFWHARAAARTMRE